MRSACVTASSPAVIKTHNTKLYLKTSYAILVLDYFKDLAF